MFLILIRHAKSSWEGNLIDHERPLSARGIEDAQLVFKKISPLLDIEYKILSSTSKRTTQTAKIFSTINAVNFEDIIFNDELYTFNLSEFEKVISKNFKKSWL